MSVALAEVRRRLRTPHNKQLQLTVIIRTRAAQARHFIMHLRRLDSAYENATKPARARGKPIPIDHFEASKVDVE